MSFKNWIRSDDPLPAPRGAPEKLVRRKGVNETMSVLSKVPQAKKRVTESKAPVQPAGRNYAEHIRAGSGGCSTSVGPIPRFSRWAASFAAQVLGLAEPPPPRPAVPLHLVPLDEVEQFIASESERLGVVWRPSLNVIVDWHRAASPFHRAAMGKVTLWDCDPPVVCLDKAGLLDLIAFKCSQILSQPKGPAAASAPVWAPTAAESEAMAAALDRARTPPSVIVAQQNAEWRRQQREQAEALAAAKGD